METKVTRKIIIGAGGIGAIALSVAAYGATAINSEAVRTRLSERLPRTQVSAIDCEKVAGLCEVVAGKTLFYTDADARYLFVGRLYDMETRRDLTAEKLLEINPDQLLGSGLAAANAGDDGEGNEQGESSAVSELAARAGSKAVPTGRGAAPATATRVDISSLPASGAIVWGRKGGDEVTIFTDFRCGYCRALVATLEKMNVRVTERPISTLGSRDLSNQVMCSRDRLAAMRDAYAGIEVRAGRQCDTDGLDANEAFARRHGFMGTPVIVRSDGVVLEGYRPRDFLEEWLGEVR